MGTEKKTKIPETEVSATSTVEETETAKDEALEEEPEEPIPETIPSEILITPPSIPKLPLTSKEVLDILVAIDPYLISSSGEAIEYHLNRELSLLEVSLLFIKLSDYLKGPKARRISESQTLKAGALFEAIEIQQEKLV